MLTRNELEQQLYAIAEQLSPELAELYQIGDPETVLRLRANAHLLSLLSQEIDIATIEPFIKSRDRSILADAVNKGILPKAVPARHCLRLINNHTSPVTLSQGRLLTDGQGREWRLMQTITLAAGEQRGDTLSDKILAEQSTVREVTYTPSVLEAFHNIKVRLDGDKHLASLAIQDNQLTPNVFNYTPKWMNVAAGDYAYTLRTDSKRQWYIEFGDSDRAGRTLTPSDTVKITLTETYGAVDANRLREAVLATINNNSERGIRIAFLSNGVERTGANPISMEQMRLLASYPSFYDENAVFLGNFDFLIRKFFITRTQYMAVWNETIQERAYGAVSLQDINHLHLTVVANNPSEQSTIEAEIAQLIGKADSLFSGGIKSISNVSGRIIRHEVVNRPYQLTISGRLSAIHDLDAVKAQIKGLLLAKYGQGQVAVSRWLADGLNLQEIATLLRNQVAAFQDRLSDFVVQGEDLSLDTVKPHQWLYLTDSSINLTGLTRNAESSGGLWTL